MDDPTAGRARRWRRRMADIWRALEWPVMWTLGGLALPLGYLGFRSHAALHGSVLSPAEAIYRTLQLFALEFGPLDPPLPATLQAARFLAPAVAIYTISKALTVIFAAPLRRLRLAAMRGHIIVAGGGRKGLSLAASLRSRGSRVVVIDRDTSSDTCAACRDRGVPLVEGDATDPGVLLRAGLRRARQLVALCGDDGINAEVTVAAGRARKKRGKRPLECIVHVFDPDLYALLARRWPNSGEHHELPELRVQFFNMFRQAARAMLEEAWPSGEPARSTSGAEADRATRGTPHLCVVGLGRLGESIVLEAARRWRATAPPGRSLQITAVDREAARRWESMSLRHPGLGSLCDVQACNVEIPSADWVHGTFLFGADGLPAATQVFVCFDDDRRSVSAALYIRERLRGHRIRIFVRTVRDTGLASLLHVADGSDSLALPRLVPCSVLERACTPEMILAGSLESLARSLHERYRSRRGDETGTDPALRPWDRLPESLKEANREQAAGLQRLLGTVGYTIVAQRSWDHQPPSFTAQEVEHLARLEHERWRAERATAGWRPGRVKNPALRSHPYLIPWEELPEEVHQGNRDFVRSLPSLLADQGYVLVRMAESDA